MSKPRSSRATKAPPAAAAPAVPPAAPRPISSVHSLRRHLQGALELEHATIPPYLCALYSIPDGANVTAGALIRSVVMEEMLHMVLAANLLNAVGGTPRVHHRKFIPAYPTYLPFSDQSFLVELLPFSRRALDTFLRMEKPAKPHAKPEPGDSPTIGQFYEAILEAFHRLEHHAKKRGETIFTGPRRLQIAGDTWYYGGGGSPVAVTDLASATHAIHEIMDQGEGLDHGIFDGDDQFGQVDELAHYFRFNEIHLGRRYQKTDGPTRPPTGAELPVDWTASYPMSPNPKAADYVGQPAIHRLMVDFNRQYTALLRALDRAFNGEPSALGDAVPIMYDLKYRAQALMAIPSGRGDGTTVGPGFEFAP
ncbi:MAG: ferritin-like protein [Gemmatimonadaceae bacterium]|nr:ferritin-like protein [Gemmatimonadaceae bacterium]